MGMGLSEPGVSRDNCLAAQRYESSSEIFRIVMISEGINLA